MHTEPGLSSLFILLGALLFAGPYHDLDVEVVETDRASKKHPEKHQ